ncbi:hydrogenase maturation protease [Saccharopolyspora rhizosphaerae]|uniref:Hydrogenase maturation protease n=1 Tax=Saccharopolyspora rhizosphaerae TaxID=2492662 RepID=A0A3R8R579_9PSEU|nr:hydrogenase maturation protease [Saccharopolyspora rhizosphaerae]RRO18657.1 hydrogenase maturation protease [Saccharopolyspora rhizosphaerae]
MRPRVLVAGIGNMFLGDDGFGPEVVRLLSARPVPEHARVIDYGIRGLHLAYELLDGYDALVLVDALPADGAPGEMRVLEVGPEHVEEADGLDAHSMNPTSVLATLVAMGGELPRTYVVGCTPLSTEESLGLSEPVAAALEPAVATITSLLNHELAPAGAGEEK